MTVKLGQSSGSSSLSLYLARGVESTEKMVVISLASVASNNLDVEIPSSVALCSSAAYRTNCYLFLFPVL